MVCPGQLIPCDGPSTAALLQRRILAEKLSALVVLLLSGLPTSSGVLRDWTASSQHILSRAISPIWMTVDGTDSTASFQERISSRAREGRSSTPS